MWVALRCGELDHYPWRCLQSFIEQEDQTTRNMCLADQRSASNFWKETPCPRAFESKPGKWNRAVSDWRWQALWIVALLALAFDVGSLIWGHLVLKARGNEFYGQFGSFGMSPERLLFKGYNASIAAMSMIANLPQMFIVLLFLMFTNYITSRQLAKDFAKLGLESNDMMTREWRENNQHIRAHAIFLMVSKPQGKQQKPYLAGIPIVAMIFISGFSVLAHWLVSQSIFPVRIDTYLPSGVLDVRKRISNCGFSRTAMQIMIPATFLIFLATLVVLANSSGYEKAWTPKSQRQDPKQAVEPVDVFLPPLVSTNSAALSAAYHLPNGQQYDDEVAFGQVRWGAVQEPTEGHPGHCALVTQRMWNEGKAWHPCVGNVYQ